MAKSTDEKAIELLFAASYQDGAEVLKSMGKVQRGRFHKIVDQLRDDTNGELTEIEYFTLAKQIYFCERIENLIQLNGMESLSKEVLMHYGKVQDTILNTLRKYREGRLEIKNSVAGLKKAMLELVGEGGELKIEYRPPDGSAVRSLPPPEDKGDGGEVLD
jgi:hypothetical protein